MDKQIIVLSASDVLMAEAQGNKPYLEITMRMMSTQVNLNKTRVTEAFIDDIVANAQDYIALPLCADAAK